MLSLPLTISIKALNLTKIEYKMQMNWYSLSLFFSHARSFFSVLHTYINTTQGKRNYTTIECMRLFLQTVHSLTSIFFFVEFVLQSGGIAEIKLHSHRTLRCKNAFVLYTYTDTYATDSNCVAKIPRIFVNYFSLSNACRKYALKFDETVAWKSWFTLFFLRFPNVSLSMLVFILIHADAFVLDSFFSVKYDRFLSATFGIISPGSNLFFFVGNFKSAHLYSGLMTMEYLK